MKVAGDVLVTLDRTEYRRARAHAWWWRAGITGLGCALLTWAQDVSSFVSLVGIQSPWFPHLLAGLLIGAVGMKRPGDIDPRFPPER